MSSGESDFQLTPHHFSLNLLSWSFLFNRESVICINCAFKRSKRQVSFQVSVPDLIRCRASIVVILNISCFESTCAGQAVKHCVSWHRVLRLELTRSRQSGDGLIEVAYIGDIDRQALWWRRPIVQWSSSRRHACRSLSYRLTACVYMSVYVTWVAVANRLLKVGLQGGGVMSV